MLRPRLSGKKLAAFNHITKNESNILIFAEKLMINGIVHQQFL